MAQTCIILNAGDRERLAAIVACSEPAKSRTGPGRAVAGRPRLAHGPADLESPPRPAPSRAHLQALDDPTFAEKVEDIVGLYMSPPAHAVVLSIDEKSQIQALRRTRPGTTTLFAALNVLDGTVLGRCMQCHRHQEFIRFLSGPTLRHERLVR